MMPLCNVLIPDTRSVTGWKQHPLRILSTQSVRISPSGGTRGVNSEPVWDTNSAGMERRDGRDTR